MEIEFEALKADDKMRDNSTIVNRMVNVLALYLDKLAKNGEYITERDRISGFIAIAIKKASWELKECYPFCKFKITYTGHIPILGTIVYVKQIEGIELSGDNADSIKKLIADTGYWSDPEYGIFNRRTVLIRGRFVSSS